ncbi:PREDICTED: coiled-coil domain-containing protein 93 [Ipomoea nil]|uniref:coiled-coil domain-containing protein 93 n=1 Tax=Ipomoea nil TaxID=35883 RepID=UPI000901B505|nr:PREDICTED: coiled-coil domain-containing protein 93 [Ipomoea nil]
MTRESNVEELKQEKNKILNEINGLQEKIDPTAQRLLSLLETLKALEKQHSELHCTLRNSKLQSKINELEEVEQNTKEGKLSNSFDHSLSDSNERLDSVKKELASKLRAIMSLKRSLDSVPSQAELIQYELRLSELNTHIQGKHCQTQKYYATFNTLLEIKELMLKETSLLNSISSQFQNAITSPAGREKLISSMEGILQGTQQKLEKVQLALESEMEVREIRKAKFVSTISEQRKCNALLKTLQVERAKNESLCQQTSESAPSGVQEKL